MSEWGGSDPFKFSRHLYAPTVSTDTSSSAPTVIHTDISRHTYNKFKPHFPRYPPKIRSDAKSIKSSMTHASSLKSSTPYKHKYYESVESLPSSASVPSLLPSVNLNPPPIKLQWYQKPIVWIKILSIFFLTILFILSLIYYHFSSFIFNPYLNTMKVQHDWGIVLFSVMLFISILLMLPQTMFIIHACIIITNIWGKSKGILLTISVVWGINFIASTMCYFYGRFLLRNIIQQCLQKFPLISMVENSIFYINGWKFVLLLRLLPLNTYNLMNYVLGFTSLDLCGHIIGCLGMIPNIVLYCLIGVYLHSKIKQILFIVMIVEVVISIVSIVWCSMWLYWNVSNEYDNKERESVFVSHPSDMFDNENYEIEQRESLMINEPDALDVYDLNENMSVI